MSAVETGSDIQALGLINQIDCAASVWVRGAKLHALVLLDQIDPDHLPTGREIVRPSHVKETIAQMCANLDDVAPELAHWLIDDASALTDQFVKAMNAEYVRLKFNVVTSNSCRKWHKDHIKARLVCTYRGTGTQYGIAGAAKEPNDIFTLDSASPIILRGALWPESPATGLLHRSPPIEGTGEVRLLFVVDVVENPEEEF